MDAVAASTGESALILNEEEKAKLREIKKQIDAGNSNTIIQYGAGVQSKISDFADKMLSEVRAKDTGDIGKALSDLMLKIKEVDLGELSGGTFLSKLPFVGSLVDNAKRFMTKYQTLSVQVIKIVEGLERAKTQLVRDSEMLGQFYDRNTQYFRELGLYVLAGQEKLQEFTELLPRVQRSAEASGDPVQIQKYQDMVQLAGRLEKKVHDLRLSRTVALQAGPQIRLVQNNNQELAEKIQSSILNTVPLWKNQIVLAVTLLRNKQALELQTAVSETTKGLLERNAEMLRESSVQVAQEAEKGIVDIETLKKVNAELISTIDQTIRIHQEGTVRRRQAEQELEKLERELKDKLLEIKAAAKADQNFI